MSLSRILVPVKRVVDFSVKIRVKPDQSGVELDNVKMSMNPFDEIALEEAVKLKEKGICKEVIAVSIGPAACVDTLRNAMALGADRSIHIETLADIQPLSVAKLLKKIVEMEKPELVITGKQAIDDDSNQTGQLLAGLLGWSQGTFIDKVDINFPSLQIKRETDVGQETLSMEFPAVITADLRLNTPRFAKLNLIMKARKMPVAKFTPADLGVDIKERLKVLSVTEPPQRKAGVKVSSVDELLASLKKAGVLNLEL